LHRPATFTATFVATRDCVDGLKAFRALLKAALRTYGLRAIDVRERALDARIDERALAQTGRQTMSAFSDRIRANRKAKGVFKVADFEGGEKTFTIAGLDEGMQIFGKSVDLLCFQETGQQFQLNQTTSEWLLDHLGDEPSGWIGKRVTLFLDEYTYEGETKVGIRLKRPVASATREPTRSSAPTPGNGKRSDLNDEIPY
jgi:hypothetical protein